MDSPQNGLLTLVQIADVLMRCLFTCPRAALLTINLILRTGYSAYGGNVSTAIYEYTSEDGSTPVPVAVVTVNGEQKYLFFLAEDSDEKSLAAIRRACFLFSMCRLPLKGKETEAGEEVLSQISQILPVPILLCLKNGGTTENVVQVYPGSLKEYPTPAVYVCRVLSLSKDYAENGGFAVLAPVRILKYAVEGPDLTAEQVAPLRRIVKGVHLSVKKAADKSCMTQEGLDLLREETENLFAKVYILPKTGSKRVQRRAGAKVLKQIHGNLKSGFDSIILDTVPIQSTAALPIHTEEVSPEAFQQLQHMNKVIAVHDMHDNVFTDLFRRKRWLLELYRELHPEDKITTIHDVVLDTLTRILTNQEYNDLSFIVRNHYMILVEAQSTWNDNILIRLPKYYFQILDQYLTSTEQNLLGEKVTIPIPEFYVVYTGDPSKVPKDPRLVVQFFDINEDLDSLPTYLDIKAVILTAGKFKGSILDQYISFSRNYREASKTTQWTRENILKFIVECQTANILSDYLEMRKEEVIDMVLTLNDCNLGVFRYGEGRYNEGKNEGKNEGIYETKRDSILRFKRKGYSDEVIAEGLDCSLEMVRQVIAEALKQKRDTSVQTAAP